MHLFNRPKSNSSFTYKPLIFDPTFSESARHPVYIKTYEQSMKLYGTPITYTYANGFLQPNHKAKQSQDIQPENKIAEGVFEYIIKLIDDVPTMLIGLGSHYFITNGPVEEKTNGQVSLLAAGKIFFDKDTHTISKIDDFSGGFHIPENISLEEKRKYSLSILMALDAVNLPLDKFIPTKSQDYPQGNFVQIIERLKKKNEISSETKLNQKL